MATKNSSWKSPSTGEQKQIYNSKKKVQIHQQQHILSTGDYDIQYP